MLLAVLLEERISLITLVHVLSQTISTGFYTRLLHEKVVDDIHAFIFFTSHNGIGTVGITSCKSNNSQIKFHEFKIIRENIV